MRIAQPALGRRRMKILVIADTVHDLVYSPTAAERFKDIDLVLSCGDVSFDYLEFVVSALNKPLFFVFGNHAECQVRLDGSIKLTPEGCRNIHRRVVSFRGVLIAGLEGSMRYRSGDHQYTDWQMRLMVCKMLPRLLWNRLFHGRALDILVTHAPPRGIHDAEDRCHRGFAAFLWLIDHFPPRYLVHGHTHLYRQDAPRVAKRGATTVINSYGYQIIEIEPPAKR